MILRPPSSTRCPCTTLCRSRDRDDHVPVLVHGDLVARVDDDGRGARLHDRRPLEAHPRLEQLALVDVGLVDPLRSEEHTSELQSRQYPVCRFLLEKKKYTVL